MRTELLSFRVVVVNSELDTLSLLLDDAEAGIRNERVVAVSVTGIPETFLMLLFSESILSELLVAVSLGDIENFVLALTDLTDPVVPK